MPAEVIFLQTKEPLAEQVTRVLLEGKNARPLDLSDTQVWVPTAGAGRRIRAALASLAGEWGTGVLSPSMHQPMQALLPVSPVVPIASRSEREAAWLAELRSTAPEEWEDLLPEPAVLESIAGGLGVAGMFCDLCDLLAESGLDPAHPALAKVCVEDAARWQQLHQLYQGYRQRLKAHDLADPNVLRSEYAAQPQPPTTLRRVVVACIPDLAEVAAGFLERVSRRKNIRVTILIWKPAELAAGWDEWGRPDPAAWTAVPVSLAAAQIFVGREALDEARGALDFLEKADTPGDFALALADPSLSAVFCAEIAQRHGVPFLPEGRPLAGEEAARIALQWDKWREDGDLRGLRTLLQLPHFNRWLGRRANLFSDRILSACDFMIAGIFAENRSQARAYFEEARGITPADAGPPPRDLTDAAALLEALDQASTVSFVEILSSAWQRSPEQAAAAVRVLELWQGIAESPLFARWPEGKMPALARALRSENIFSGAPDDAFEISGWLETPWIEAERLAIGGCVEGSLPTSVGEHPFLPDSRRSQLGLQDNRRRLARDTCLLSCLLARYPATDLQISFSRFDADGSPTLPSRLLLRGDSLPERVLQIFAPQPASGKQPNRDTAWRWSLPEALRRPPLTKISPTQCQDYLACPMRFYWKKVLHLDAYDADPREMDPRSFGILLHRTLESFSRKAPDEGRAATIEKVLMEELAAEAARLFGPDPTAALRVQMEAARVRLRAFARVQAEEFAAGWRIVEVERRFSVEGPEAVCIGPLKLSAQIDRIERHPDLGWRIMDYKSSSKGDAPAKKHFGRARPDHFLPEAVVMVEGKAHTWTDLQLPLYRYLAEKTLGAAPVQVAYFTLPADPSETKVVALDLADDLYQSGIQCAAEIARRISLGIYWPPQVLPATWSDALQGLRVNGDVEDCLDPDTIQFLKGQP